MNYADVTLVGNILQRDLTTYERAELSTILGAIKIWIDKRLNSRFDEVSESTRYYDGGVSSLDIDPCTAITSISSINDDASSSYIYTAGTEYIAEPQNETVKRELRTRLGCFPHGAGRIGVTAKFSEYDSGVPSDIQIIAARLAAGVINAGLRASTSNVSSEALEGHSISYDNSITGVGLDGIAEADPTVKSILESRKELYVDDYDPAQKLEYGDDGLLL